MATEEQQTETSRLIELVGGEIPKGKRVVTIFEPKILMCEATEDILKKRKPEKANFYKKYKLRGQGPAEGRIQYAIQYLTLEDDPNYEGRLRKIYEQMVEDRRQAKAVTKDDWIPYDLMIKGFRRDFPEIDFEGE